MSAARWRAIWPSSGSIIRDFAAGSRRERSSAIRTAMRSSSAGIKVLGSGGGGCSHTSWILAQPAHRKSNNESATRRMLLQDLEQACGAHATADAHRHHAELGLAAPSFQQQMAGHARARHAVGMADRNRAAVDIELGRIDTELVGAVDNLAGESLVQLPQIDVADLQAVALEQPRDSERRPDAHLVRLASGNGESAKDAERLDAAPGGFGAFHDDGSRRAIGELRSIAGGDVLALLDLLTAAEHGLERTEAFQGRVGPVAFVA